MEVLIHRKNISKSVFLGVTAELSPNHLQLLHNLPLLRIRYARRVEPIGKLIGGPCRVMPHEGCGEVLWHPCALTLSDEPLASAVEHGPMQLRVEAAQVGIPLHHFIDSCPTPLN